MAEVKEWREVPGWTGMHVTRDGEIRGRQGRTLQGNEQHGHLSVNVNIEGKQKRLFIHRAVLLAFAGPCPEGQECRHLNGKKADNRLSNLKWGTKLEQKADDERNRVPSPRKRKLTMADAEAIRARGHGWARAGRFKGTSNAEESRRYRVSLTVIGCIRRGETYK